MLFAPVYRSTYIICEVEEFCPDSIPVFDGAVEGNDSLIYAAGCCSYNLYAAVVSIQTSVPWVALTRSNTLQHLPARLLSALTTCWQMAGLASPSPNFLLMTQPGKARSCLFLPWCHAALTKHVLKPCDEPYIARRHCHTLHELASRRSMQDLWHTVHNWFRI